MAEIGKNIMARRKLLGMTQEELARKMGYKSKSTINKIESGINDIPQSKIVKFAEALATTPAELMGWEKVEKKAEILSDIVLRAKMNEEFLALLEMLRDLDEDQIRSVKQMISSFLK